MHISSSLSWQNPDTVAIWKAKQEQDKHSKLDEQTLLEHAPWSDFGSITAGGSAAIGAGGGLNFSVGFNMNAGKFYLRAHAEAVCGVGLSGSIGYEVSALHIIEFVAFVYHKIKDQNFSFVGMFVDDAFEAFKNLMTKYLYEAALEMEELIEADIKGIKNLIRWWGNLTRSIVQDDKVLIEAEKFAHNINRAPEKLRYTPPEVKGRMLALFTQENLQERIEHQAQGVESELSRGIPYNPEVAKQIATVQAEQIQQAMVNVLSYIQSDADFANVIQHMSLDGAKVDDAQFAKNEDKLYQGLGFYGRFQASKMPHVSHLVEELQAKTVYPQKIQPNSPVKQNKGVIKYG